MPVSRLAVIDIARGLAVVAMVIYHFSWDLSWFAFVNWPVAQGSGWRVFAGSIAGSFLFLAGISLDLAHHEAIRWRAFWKRFAMIVAAAAAVSVATYFAFQDSFVRFGILHSIAAASLIALPFTRLPWWAAPGAAALFLSLPLWGSTPFFNGVLWLWTGLGTTGFASVDYVPVAPWAGVTLAGLALSRAFRTYGIWQKLAGLTFQGIPGKGLRLFGRHSLVIYLLHQPLLFGLVWSVAQAMPGHDRAGIAFVHNCTQACQETYGSPEACEPACACTLERLKADLVWDALNEDPQTLSLPQNMNETYAPCLADATQAAGVHD